MGSRDAWHGESGGEKMEITLLEQQKIIIIIQTEIYYKISLISGITIATKRKRDQTCGY